MNKTKQIKTGITAAVVIAILGGTMFQPTNVQASATYKRTKIVKVSKKAYYTTKNAKTYTLNGSAKKIRLRANHNLKDYRNSTWIRSKKTTITKHGKKYLYYYVKSSKNGVTGWVWHKYLKAGKYKVPIKKVIAKKNVATKTPSKSKLVKQVNPDATYNAKVVADKMVTMINRERATIGASALNVNDGLDTLANKRAVQLELNFSHFDSKGDFVANTMAKQMGIFNVWGGEDITDGGFETTNKALAKMLVTNFKNSVGHWNDLMDSTSSTIGVGIYQASDGTVYCAVEMGF
ncbi:CAP domain-containing protein [Lactiplantibacillus carotarum]|uniref:CAP domain-containing protein n=1 Tax=Lactiplantibacillus carotarum TaxID=2993456 RepID=UPI00298F2A77|nr:CAP domain-containing protein [Lactiplantibacillus carotarum]